jgi:predicted transcriptional regulator
VTESERIDRFEAAYNRIDRALGDFTSGGGDRRKTGFAAKVRHAANRRRHMAKYKDFLLEIGELRNALVHNRTGEDQYIAVPLESTVIELERIETAAFSPERVLPRFQRDVISLRADQSIFEAWKLMRDDGYSRYPVYDKNNGDYAAGFIGLLTSNGFARWVASQLQGTMVHVDMSKIRVADVLEKDHRKQSVVFAARNALIDDIEEFFREHQPLEAVIITEHGKPHEKPLGMICATDLAGIK